jgi:hypothetical protein
MAAELPLIQPGGKLAATDLTASQAAVASTNQFANDGQTLLEVTLGATPCNLTVTGASCSHGRPLSNVIALSASKTYVLGPFPVNEFNDGNGKVQIAFSAITNILAAALKHP